MAIGSTPLTFYQGEDVVEEFTVNDSRIASVAGYTIVFSIKVTAAAADPPLIGPITCTVTGTLTFSAEFSLGSLPPGSYTYGVRRTDSGFSWQLAQGPVTILDSVNKD